MISIDNFKKLSFLVYGLGVTGRSVVNFFERNNLKNYKVWDDNNKILFKKKRPKNLNKALKNVKKLRTQISSLQNSIKDKDAHKELIDYAKNLIEEMTAIEETLYQTKSKSNQDPLNFPIRLNNKLNI